MSGVLTDIRELNFAYLHFAQRLAATDTTAAMHKLGLSQEVASILAKLTPAQLSKLATSPMVLCRIRIDAHALLSALTPVHQGHDLQQIEAAPLLTQPAVEAIN